MVLFWFAFLYGFKALAVSLPVDASFLKEVLKSMCRQQLVRGQGFTVTLNPVSSSVLGINRGCHLPELPVPYGFLAINPLWTKSQGNLCFHERQKI